MKKKEILVFIITLIVFFGLFLVYDCLAYDRAMITAGLSEYSKLVDKSMFFEAIIVDKTDDTLVVRPTQSVPALGIDNKGYYEY